MFLSPRLFSKDGPLGTVWLAAHFYRKLRKHQVAETDICSSIDNILLGEVPVAFRVLGHLLIGVVRIYAKKVDYLYHDCNEALIRIRDSVAFEKIHVCQDVPSVPYMHVTLPERFELDAFNLGDWENDHIGPGSITLEEASAEEENQLSSACKEKFVEKIKTCTEAKSDAVVLEDDKKVTCALERKLTDQEVVSVDFTFSERFLLHDTMEVDMEINGASKVSYLDAMMEKLRGHQLLQAESMDFDTCSRTTEDSAICQKLDKVSTNLHQLNSVEVPRFHPPGTSSQQSHQSHQLSCSKASNEVMRDRELSPQICLNFDRFCEATNLLDPIHHSDEAEYQVETIMMPDVVHPEVEKPPALQISPVGSPIKSNFLPTPVAVTPDFMIIPTPTRREQKPLQRKRKRSFDESITLSNQVIRQGLQDTSTLIRKHKDVPHTYLDVWWKIHKADMFHQIFMAPLNPYIADELKSLFRKDHFDHQDPSKVHAEHCKSDDMGFQTPIRSSNEKFILPNEVFLHQICPITSVDASQTARDVRLETSIASQGENILPVGTPDIELCLMDEGAAPLEEYENTDKWSLRTRAVAYYLKVCFEHRKDQNQNEIVSLSSILKGRNRTKCARLFYETLVLKTEGCIDVTQDSPYGEILVQATFQIEAII